MFNFILQPLPLNNLHLISLVNEKKKKSNIFNEILDPLFFWKEKKNVKQYSAKRRE